MRELFLTFLCIRNLCIDDKTIRCTAVNLIDIFFGHDAFFQFDSRAAILAVSVAIIACCSWMAAVRIATKKLVSMPW